MTDIQHSPAAIAIGASAGGFEALARLLAALPPHCTAAVVVVLHRPADKGELLAPLLARRCVLPVKEAEDKEPVAGGTVYLAPPDYHLLVEPGPTLALSRAEPLNFSRPAIDLLFESAALAWRRHLLGIVLTGANHDGAAGLQQIRSCGGSAWVQDPDDAAVRFMPDAALAQAGADAVLTLAAMCARLPTLFRQCSEGQS